MSAEVERPARMEDRRVRRTRAQLRTAFTSLMAEKPINQITVRELADRADVNRGTFYTHCAGERRPVYRPAGEPQRAALFSAGERSALGALYGGVERNLSPPGGGRAGKLRHAVSGGGDGGPGAQLDRPGLAALAERLILSGIR